MRPGCPRCHPGPLDAWQTRHPLEGIIRDAAGWVAGECACADQIRGWHDGLDEFREAALSGCAEATLHYAVKTGELRAELAEDRSRQQRADAARTWCIWHLLDVSHNRKTVRSDLVQLAAGVLRTSEIPAAPLVALGVEK